MTAFNIVRVRVKPGHEEAFINEHRNITPEFPGFHRFSLIKTGERAYCMVGEWESMESIVNARPAMIETLDHIRGMLEDLGNDLGVTDPVSGEAVFETHSYEYNILRFMDSVLQRFDVHATEKLCCESTMHAHMRLLDFGLM